MVLDVISVLVLLSLIVLVVYKIATDKDLQLAIVFSIITLIIVGIIAWSMHNVVQMFMNG